MTDLYQTAVLAELQVAVKAEAERHAAASAGSNAQEQRFLEEGALSGVEHRDIVEEFKILEAEEGSPMLGKE